MITKELFIKAIKSVEVLLNEGNKLWDDHHIEIGESPLYTESFVIFEVLIASHFNEYGIDWIMWYIFEGKHNIATDENGNRICYDLDSLYEYVKQYQL